MSTKAALRSVNDAIREQNFDDAVVKAYELLNKDAKNYQGHIFLAFALDQKNLTQEAEATYEAATTLRPKDSQAYQGLIKLYERQGPGRLADYQRVVVRLAHIYFDADDMYKCQDVVDKFVDFARVRGDKLQYADALWIQLPESLLWGLLEGRFPKPARTYEAIAHILEDFEKKRINKLIGERRTRLGANIHNVTTEVKREVYGQSQLEHIYRRLIDWTSDDDQRRLYEEKLLQYCLERLLVSPAGAKPKQQSIVLGLARDMVTIRHPFKLAWDIALNWQDNKEIADWEADILRSYCAFFPESDMYKVITAFLTSSCSPFPAPKKQDPKAAAPSVSVDSDDDDEDGGAPTSFVPLTDEDRLMMIAEAMGTTESILVYRLVGQFFLQMGDYESTVEAMRKALRFVTGEAARIGMSFKHTQDAYSICLATALVYHQSPRHHQEAKTLFDQVLEHDERCTSALIGVGLIFEEEQEYAQAIDFFDRALDRDGSNLRVKSEAAWVRALKGDWEVAKDELLSCVEPLQQQDTTDKELLAETRYRIGYCLWHLYTGQQARKQRKGECAYAYWLAALSSNLNHAPAYTSLGIFYSDYAKDRKRARRCFQKALELSPGEVVAAERLAKSFALDADWDRVELVAQRVVDSGKVRPPPGSKRKGISWPFAALGVAELNKQDFHKAIVSFQAALRLSPDDYNSWVGLGESYHSSGRYVAATKAIQHAQSLEASMETDALEYSWFTKYMLANIQREVYEFDEAIALYRDVLESRPDEEGVCIALLQTTVESGLASIEKGLFAKAVQLAQEAIEFAAGTKGRIRETFNYWKTFGDACSIFSTVQSRLVDFPVQIIKGQLADSPQEAFDRFADVDKVGTDVVYAKGIYATDEQPGVDLTRCVHATILCHKQAVHAATGDVHALAVAHYNLGWAEFRAHACLPRQLRKRASSYLRASVRAFKRSIELESGNAEFWNALGVVTSEINPAVSQHALVRSLHLDERSPATWTNLGTLALLSDDVKFANEAFTRAQSADPEYSHAWLGQAFVALLLGETKEARGLFAHVMDIAESSSIPSRQHYSASTFDHVLTAPPGMTVVSLIQPLFALEQVHTLRPQDLTFAHLSTLFQERIGDWARALPRLDRIRGVIEADYEATESAESLTRFMLVQTDLARAYLAARSHTQAVDCGETALGLSGEERKGELAGERRKKARLSAHLTVGLARYHLGAFAEAEKSLQAALEESDNSADAACLLAQVLWAQGSEASRERARTTLYDVISKQPGHVRSVLLLGVVALLDGDESSLEAVVEELHGLRTSDGVTATEQRQMAMVLRAIAGAGQGPAAEQAVLGQAQEDVMQHPELPHGWAALAEATGDGHAAQMALKTALGGMPPRGELEAQTVAYAHTGTGLAADAQKAVLMAPWMREGWESLQAATEAEG